MDISKELFVERVISKSGDAFLLSTAMQATISGQRVCQCNNTSAYTVCIGKVWFSKHLFGLFPFSFRPKCQFLMPDFAVLPRFVGSDALLAKYAFPALFYKFYAFPIFYRSKSCFNVSAGSSFLETRISTIVRVLPLFPVFFVDYLPSNITYDRRALCNSIFQGIFAHFLAYLLSYLLVSCYFLLQLVVLSSDLLCEAASGRHVPLHKASHAKKSWNWFSEQQVCRTKFPW